METPKKRPRGPNFTLKEKEVLLTLVSKYKAIIENKKTDGVSVSEKKQAWFKLTQEFNACAPNNCFRDTEGLKKYYDNLKEDLRKRAGEQQKSVYKTGGGPPSPKKTAEYDDLLLGLVNKKTIFGLPNKYDCDKVQETPSAKGASKEEYDLQNIEIIFEDDSNNNLDTDKLEIRDAKADNGWANSTPSSSANKDMNKDKYEDTSHNWARIKASDLEKPLNPKLKENIKRAHTSVLTRNTVAKKKTANSARRRPTTVKVLSSSTLGEKYENLLNKKLELADAFKKEHDLRMTMLRFDIALKKKDLLAAGIEDMEIALLESPDLMM